MPSAQTISVGAPRVPSLPNAPANISVCTSSASQNSNSRQNLNSLIEAIGHLEGDHLFSEDHHQQVRDMNVDFFKFISMNILIWIV